MKGLKFCKQWNLQRNIFFFAQISLVCSTAKMQPLTKVGFDASDFHFIKISRMHFPSML